MGAVVPAEMNAQAVEVLREGIPAAPYGAPLTEAFEEGSFARRLVGLPEIAGAIYSLVGPDPTVDHHAVHIRRAREGTAQNLHGDAIIDVRPDAFDVQLMYYPQEVTLDMGGTLSVPGSHLRRTNESDTGRYQNLRGQSRLTCPAGTVVVFHPVSGTAGGATTATSTGTCSRSASTRRSGSCGCGTPTICTTPR